MVVTTRAFDRPRPGPIGHGPTEENCRQVRTLRPPSPGFQLLLQPGPEPARTLEERPPRILVGA